MKRGNGLSVIIPTFESGAKLHRSLSSLDKQTADKSSFEVLVVSNGSRRTDVAEIRTAFPELNLRFFHSPSAGAGRARNIGLSMAGREFTTFLDDDDFLEPEFIQSSLELATDSTVVLMPIVDYKGETLDRANSLNTRISAIAGTTIAINKVPWALGFNACKVFSTRIAQKLRYREELGSGEDLVYFAELLTMGGLTITVSAQLDKNAYVREMTEESVSRRKQSFEFSVRQRLECIAELQKLEVGEANLGARRSIENAQFEFVRRYLKQHPEEVLDAIELSAELGVIGCDWEDLRKEKASRLVFSYCFPPYSDTSANMSAKIIRAEGQLVDVFYADMSAVRKKDLSTLRIIAPYVVHAEEISSVPSFSNWKLISDFALKATRQAQRRMKRDNSYNSMYSRALWSGSHVAALLFKRRNPKVSWEAEFSDPLTQGVDGKPRVGELTGGLVTVLLKRMLKRTKWGTLPYQSHFELTEILTLIYAEELIFTNKNQQKVIVEKYPPEFQEFVNGKSKVRQHSVPGKELYEMSNPQYYLDEGKVNLAYFGNFYPNRGIGEVLQGLESLAPEERADVRLHIFAGDPKKVEREIQHSSARNVVVVNPFVDYLSFLNLLTRFDVLIVNDTDTKNSAFTVNPFLPSKYSDYLGSGTSIWGLVFPESELSKMSVDYRSVNGEGDTVSDILSQLLMDFKK